MLNMIAYTGMFDSFAMAAQTSPMTPSPLLSAWQNVTACSRSDRSYFKKMRERSGNVIENKGSLWKTDQQSRNVYENKGA
jgi:hypothetical protein